MNHLYAGLRPKLLVDVTDTTVVYRPQVDNRHDGHVHSVKYKGHDRRVNSVRNRRHDRHRQMATLDATKTVTANKSNQFFPVCRLFTRLLTRMR